MNHEYPLSEQTGTCHIQVSLNIARSGLDDCSSVCTISGNDNLISDVVSQHVLILGEDINSLDVEVQKIRGPRGGASIYDTVFSWRTLRLMMRNQPIDPLTGSERSILNTGDPYAVSLSLGMASWEQRGVHGVNSCLFKGAHARIVIEGVVHAVDTDDIYTERLEIGAIASTPSRVCQGVNEGGGLKEGAGGGGVNLSW